RRNGAIAGLRSPSLRVAPDGSRSARVSDPAVFRDRRSPRGAKAPGERETCGRAGVETAAAAVPDFAAFPHRRMFLGQYHRWLVMTPAGPVPWSTDDPLALSQASAAFGSRASSSAGVSTGMGEPAKPLGSRVTMASRPARTAHSI